MSLEVRPGEVVALVGESGCGKTTLARMLLGLLPPTAGEIRIGGEATTALPRRAIAALVQPVFQDPYSSLNPRKSIGSIIALPLRVQGGSDSATWRRRVEEMMERVGLARSLHDNFPSQLSGGQRQRVAIARALINRPRLVICDEPTSALDVSVQSQILNLLQELRRDMGLTYLLISHNLAVVEHMATRVAVMYLGRIVEEADTDTLFRAPKHPYTQALLASVLTPEPGLGVPDTHLGAAYPNPLDVPPGCRFHPRCARVMEVVQDRCADADPHQRRLRRMPSLPGRVGLRSGAWAGAICIEKSADERQPTLVSVLRPPETEIPIYVTPYTPHKDRHAGEAMPTSRSAARSLLPALGAPVGPHGPHGAHHRGDEGGPEQDQAGRQRDHIAHYSRKCADAGDNDQSLEEKYPSAFGGAFPDLSHCAPLASRPRGAPCRHGCISRLDHRPRRR